MNLKIFSLILGVLCLVTNGVRCEEGEEKLEEETNEINFDNIEDMEGEDAPEENDVLILDKHNFDEVVNNKDIILVEFYAPWCGHCKNLAPKYEAAAARLKETDPTVPLAKVDGDAERDLSAKYDVTGYPALKYFIKGKAFDYDGARDEDGIVEYMMQVADPNYKLPPEACVDLAIGNFTEIVNSQELMLVEFYAPWCGHCKRVAPDYEKAAKVLKYQDPPIMLAKIDATIETALASRFSITSYPTFKIFRKGKPYEYKGGQNQHSFVDTMNGQRGDVSKLQYDDKEMARVKTKEDVTVFGFFKKDTSKEFEIYIDATNELREDNYKMAHSFDKGVRKHFDMEANSIILYAAERFFTKYEPRTWTFDVKKETKAEEIVAFIKSHSRPLVGHMNWQNKQKRYEDRPLVLFFYTVDFTFDGAANTQLWRNKITEIAKDYKGLPFAIVDEDDFMEIFREFGFEDSGEEMHVGILGTKDRKYPMEDMEEFDSDAIREFVDNFQKGLIKPKIKSQPIPRKKGPVKVVVGSTFDKIVLDKSKDVLIEFYAPWCGHCKSLDPIYKKLAKKFKNEENLVIAKIDSTANDAPDEYPADGFPTIYFAASNNKNKPVKYEGERDLDHLSEFVDKHATVSLGKGEKDEL